MVEGRVVDSNLDDFSSFSGNLFAVLVNYFEMEDIGSGMVDGNAVFVNCTSEIIIVFFYSIFQTSAGFSYVRKVEIFFWAWPFVFLDYVLFKLWWTIIVRVHKDRY